MHEMSLYQTRLGMENETCCVETTCRTAGEERRKYLYSTSCPTSNRRVNLSIPRCAKDGIECTFSEKSWLIPISHGSRHIFNRSDHKRSLIGSTHVDAAQYHHSSPLETAHSSSRQNTFRIRVVDDLAGTNTYGKPDVALCRNLVIFTHLRSTFTPGLRTLGNMNCDIAFGRCPLHYNSVSCANTSH